jgi:hypothetical protein
MEAAGFPNRQLMITVTHSMVAKLAIVMPAARSIRHGQSMRNVTWVKLDRLCMLTIFSLQLTGKSYEPHMSARENIVSFISPIGNKGWEDPHVKKQVK